MKNKIKFIAIALILSLMKIGSVSAYKNMATGTKSCGDGLITNIPSTIIRIIHILYIALQIIVPILLVIFGSIDLIKAVTAGKEDDIKKAQGVFIKRLIAGALVFFVLAIVKLTVNIAGDEDKSSKIVSCVNCFLNKTCD